MDRCRHAAKRGLLYGGHSWPRERSRALPGKGKAMTSIPEEKCQRGELNSRPRAYESPALPLSYPGDARQIECCRLHVSTASPALMIAAVAAPLALNRCQGGRYRRNDPND